MKRLVILGTGVLLCAVGAQALKLKNDYPDDVAFAIQRFNPSSPNPIFEELGEISGPGEKEVSIISSLQEARKNVKPDSDAYLKFMVRFGRSGDYQEAKIPSTSEMNERWLHLGNKSDEELKELDQNYTLIALANKTAQFQKNQ